MNDHKFPAAQINAEIERWQKKLSLGEWEITWNIAHHQSSVVTQECKAQVFYLCGGRCATISFSPFATDWKHQVRHEMLEILLGDLQKMIDPKYEEWVVEAAKHSIIRRLEGVLK